MWTWFYLFCFIFKLMICQSNIKSRTLAGLLNHIRSHTYVFSVNIKKCDTFHLSYLKCRFHTSYHLRRESPMGHMESHRWNGSIFSISVNKLNAWFICVAIPLLDQKVAPETSFKKNPGDPDNGFIVRGKIYRGLVQLGRYSSCFYRSGM